MKNIPGKILHALLLLMLVLGRHTVMAQETSLPPLLINEVQVSNIDQFLDNANCYGSWVEIYNPADTAQPLRNMYLTDGVNEFRLLSSQGSVPSHGFKTIYFDHYYSDGQYGTKARLQAPFKLEPDGGTISLLDAERSIVSSVSYPPAIPRCSWARTSDGGEEWSWTGEPTPAASNNASTSAEFRLEAPEVNPDSHFFTEAFIVRVNVPSGYTLRYTLDGSAPTASNGYTSTTGRITVNKTTILRLCFFLDGYLPSPVVTKSYIYRNHDYYLPVLSVVSEPKNFFDDKVGVFVKGTNGVSGNGQSTACNWNMDWERPVNMEYWVPETNEEGTGYKVVVNQEADLEISGGWTRAYGAATVDGRYWEARSSFRLKTDKRYEGVNAISYPIFTSKPHNKYRCWQVRNGGNDTYARIKDPAIQQMVIRSGFYIDCQEYQPAHVFLNGEYYGMLNIRESNNKHFAYSNYGIDFDDMDQFDLSNAQYNQKMGDNKAWTQLQNWATRLSSTRSDSIYALICDLLDIDEYINYMALECYMGPSDWITNTNNVKGFRSRTDGKFHFVLFDLDSAFSFNTMLTMVLNSTSGANVDDLFRKLMRYDPFRRQFMDAYCLVDGSVFEPTRCEEIVREIYQNTNPALYFEGGRSNMGLISTIYSSYNGERINTLRNYFNPTFEIYANLSANIPEARLSVNGQEIPTGKFGGYLFSYMNEPISLAAKAPAGCRFDGWQTESDETSQSVLIPEGSEWRYFDRGSMDRYDWTSPTFDDTSGGWRTGTAPFGFGKNGYYMQENSATKLNQGSGTKRPTYYFRNTFHLDNELAEDDVLTFNYQIDDGMMLYINGHEVGGYYVSSDAKYADYTIGGHFESETPYIGSFVIPHEYLVVGENQIAVVAKNCHGTSSDMWFEASLTLKSHERNIVSPSEAFDLMQSFPAGSRVKLKAVFGPITDERERWAAGAAPLRINEVSAFGDIQISDYGKKADWLELYNTTDHDISLAGLYLSDNASKPQKYRLSEGFVPAHGTRIIWCDKKEAITELHAPFKLENADGASVSIQAADGSWADRLDYMEHGKFQTFGRYPDGGNMATILNQPTIDASNKLGMTDWSTLSDEDWLGPERTITLELAQGWNWTSHNLAVSVDKSRFLTDAIELRSQTESLLFLDEDGWQGSLQRLDAAKGYKIEMKEEREVTLRGPIFDAATPVRLSEGWNWIGCPLYSATTLEAALALCTPDEGDRIVSLDAFAIFENGEWHGTLSSFKPGQAYLFYSKSEKEFCWQSLSPMKARTKRYAPARRAADDIMNDVLSTMNYELLTMNYNIHAFPDVMTLVASVMLEDEDFISIAGEQGEADCLVGAFSGNTCRGVGVFVDGLLYMNIHGEAADEIEFRMFTADGDVYGCEQRLPFGGEKMLGSIRLPFPLRFASQEILDEVKPLFAREGKIRAVRYYNLSGQLISKPEHGLCLRKVIYEDGRTETTKVKF